MGEKKKQQKSFIRVPAAVTARIGSLPEDDFVIYTTQSFSVDELEAGALVHLDVTTSGGAVHVPHVSLPAASTGRWAQRNRVDGYVKKHTDLPKVTKTFTFESPNFGDWSRGSHSVSQSREVYQKTEIPPPRWGIEMSSATLPSGRIAITFELDHVFDRTATDGMLLLFALNVLQESAGGVDVRNSSTPVAAFVETLKVDWEILPVDDTNRAITRVIAQIDPSPQERPVLLERLEFLLKLRPANLIAGTSGSRGTSAPSSSTTSLCSRTSDTGTPCT